MRVWLAACAMTAALAAPATVQAQVEGLEIVGPDTLSITLKKGVATKSVWVLNSTKRPVTPTFETRLEDGDGAEATLVASVAEGGEVAANDVARYRLEFRDGNKVEEGAKGQLVASGAGTPGSIDLTVAKPAKKDTGVTAALLIPLAPALLIVGTIALIVTTDAKKKWDTPLSGDLDFKDSFASVATGAGAIFGTILAAGVLPEDVSGISKEGFAALNLIFGVGVVLAGLVFAAFQSPAWVDLDPDADPPTQKQEMQGTVLGFVVASIVTMWAVWGELIVLTLLLKEIGDDKGFSDVAVGFLYGAVGVVAILLLVYVARKTPAIIDPVRDKPDVKEDAGTVAGERALRAGASSAAPRRQRISLF
jgi:hypothetical protein